MPEDFTPASPVDLPNRLTDVQVTETGLTLCQAITAVRFDNRQRLEAGLVDGLWALLAFVPKGGAA